MFRTSYDHNQEDNLSHAVLYVVFFIHLRKHVHPARLLTLMYEKPTVQNCMYKWSS